MVEMEVAESGGKKSASSPERLTGPGSMEASGGRGFWVAAVVLLR